MRTSLLITACLLFGCSDALLAAPNAAALYKSCTSPQVSEQEKCAAYLNGFVAGVMMDQVAREQGEPICVDNTNTDQVKKRVLDFIRNNPQLLSLDGNGIVGLALARSYPCGKPK